jgi:hypothetical protein
MRTGYDGYRRIEPVMSSRDLGRWLLDGTLEYLSPDDQVVLFVRSISLFVGLSLPH